MKVIIFGLGNFGTALAIMLTESGSEVVGVDNKMERVNQLKEQVAHVVCLDATNELAYNSLPLDDADLAVVAIGENEGAAIITTAILKRYTHIRIISRSLSPVHDTVLQAMGIETIVHPEQEAAERLTRRLNLKRVLDSFEVDEHYSISRIRAPQAFHGKTILELNFRQRFHLNIITVLRRRERRNLFGGKTYTQESLGLPTPDMALAVGDILVVFGANSAIAQFCSDLKVPEEM